MMLTRSVQGLQATKATFTGKASRSRLVCRAEGEQSIAKVDRSKDQLYFSSESTLQYLDGTLPGDFGFDPLGLMDPVNSGGFITPQWLQYSEVIHCRWAMLGAAGCLGVEVLGQGNWYDAPLWAVNGGAPTWFGITVPFDLNTLLAIEFVAMAAAETRRGDETDPVKRIYPGGAFDPLNFAKGDIESLKLKEIKNGRLAMMACLGFVAQHAATGKTPLQALGDHISNPWGSNFATNGVSLPF